jgi:hypothetical protein
MGCLSKYEQRDAPQGPGLWAARVGSGIPYAVISSRSSYPRGTRGLARASCACNPQHVQLASDITEDEIGPGHEAGCFTLLRLLTGSKMSLSGPSLPILLRFPSYGRPLFACPRRYPQGYGIRSIGREPRNRQAVNNSPIRRINTRLSSLVGRRRFGRCRSAQCRATRVIAFIFIALSLKEIKSHDAQR